MNDYEFTKFTLPGKRTAYVMMPNRNTKLILSNGTEIEHTNFIKVFPDQQFEDLPKAVQAVFLTAMLP